MPVAKRVTYIGIDGVRIVGNGCKVEPERYFVGALHVEGKFVRVTPDGIEQPFDSVELSLPASQTIIEYK